MSINRKWRSIAVWPDTIRVGHIVGKNESDDTHDSKGQAEAVCRLLEKHGFGGEGNVFPVSTRVVQVTRAMVCDNLLETIEAVLPGGGHREDGGFLRLRDRIEGKIVTLVFTGDDAFEEKDNNYWLPKECWEEVA
jgi:hypothetical protein